MSPPRDSASPDLWVCQLGLVPYQQAVSVQEQIRARRLAGEVPDTLLLLEHPRVYTRGRRSQEDELPLGASFYRAQGIEVLDTDRGGRTTFHGPGQLVGYPIMRIEHIDRYLRTMEDAISAALATHGISARGRPLDGPDYTGVWVGERKIASIGLHLTRGVSTHGFAVNVDNDLEPFCWIVACGLASVSMTSLALEAGTAGSSLPCFRKRAAQSFCRAQGRRQRLVWPPRLGIADTHAAGLAAERAPIKTIEPTRAEPVPA